MNPASIIEQLKAALRAQKKRKVPPQLPPERVRAEFAPFLSQGNRAIQSLAQSISGCIYHTGQVRGPVRTVFAMLDSKNDIKFPKTFSNNPTRLVADVVLIQDRLKIEQFLSTDRMESLQDDKSAPLIDVAALVEDGQSPPDQQEDDPGSEGEQDFIVLSDEDDSNAPRAKKQKTDKGVDAKAPRSNESKKDQEEDKEDDLYSEDDEYSDDLEEEDEEKEALEVASDQEDAHVKARPHMPPLSRGDDGRPVDHFRRPEFVEELCHQQRRSATNRIQARVRAEKKKQLSKIRVSGWVPFVWKHTVYELKLRETYVDAKNGWQWQIKACNAHAPWHDEKQFRRFVKFAMKQTVLFDNPSDPTLFKQHAKEFEREYFRSVREADKIGADLDFVKQWFAASPYAECSVGKCIAASSSEQSMERPGSVYPLLRQAYDPRRLTQNNPWWIRLSDEYKARWEASLQEPQSAYAMCFRSLMDPYFQLGSPIAAAQLLRHKLLHEKEVLEAQLEHYRALRGSDAATMTDKLGDLAVRMAQVELKLALQVVHAVDKVRYVPLDRNDTADPHTCHPEISYQNFRALCAHQNWAFDLMTPVKIEQERKAIQRQQNLHAILRPRKVVPDLAKMMASILAYQWFMARFTRDHHCAFPEKQVPQEHGIGVQYLVDRQVLCRIVEEDVAYVVPMYWARCKQATATLLRAMQIHHVPLPVETFMQRLHDIQLVLERPLTDLETSFLQQVNENALSCLRGAFGTGKTEYLRLVRQMFPSMLVVGFTGASVDNAGERVASECSTMHAINWEIAASGGEVHRKKYDCVSLDEASQVTELLFMETTATARTRRWLWIGDERQIAAFGPYAGNLFEELLAVYPTTELTYNYRQARDPTNLIIPNATAVRAFDWKLKYDGGASFSLLPSYEHGVTATVARVGGVRRFRGFQWLTATREHADDLNYLTLLNLRETDDTAQALQNTWKSARRETVLQTVWPGDRIMFGSKIQRSSHDQIDGMVNGRFYRDTYQHVGNTTRTLFVNGARDEVISIGLSSDPLFVENHPSARSLPFVTRERFRALRTDGQTTVPQPDGTVLLRLRSGRVIRLSDDFHHGYAITVDRFQGREEDMVCLSLKDYEGSRFLKEEFGNSKLYTAIGRARRWFAIIGVRPPQIKEIVENHKRRRSLLRVWLRNNTPV